MNETYRFSKLLRSNSFAVIQTVEYLPLLLDLLEVIHRNNKQFNLPVLFFLLCGYYIPHSFADENVAHLGYHFPVEPRTSSMPMTIFIPLIPAMFRSLECSSRFH